MRIAILLSAAAFIAQPVAAQPSGVPLRPAEISVSAQGQSRTAPDRAVITLGVQSRAATASEAARENSRVQRAVLDTLRAMGFRNDQISTANYSVRPEYAPPPERGSEPRIAGYVVSNTVQVTLHQTERLGQVIDAALSRGANVVHGVAFTLSDPAPARREAIADAVAKARADAEALARAAGGSVGRVLMLTTSQGGGGSGILRSPMSVTLGMETPMEPGVTSVTATVTGRWEFVPR